MFRCCCVFLMSSISPPRVQNNPQSQYFSQQVTGCLKLSKAAGQEVFWQLYFFGFLSLEIRASTK